MKAKKKGPRISQKEIQALVAALRIPPGQLAVFLGYRDSRCIEGWLDGTKTPTSSTVEVLLALQTLVQTSDARVLRDFLLRTGSLEGVLELLIGEELKTDRAKNSYEMHIPIGRPG